MKNLTNTYNRVWLAALSNTSVLKIKCSFPSCSLPSLLSLSLCLYLTLTTSLSHSLSYLISYLAVISLPAISLTVYQGVKLLKLCRKWLFSWSTHHSTNGPRKITCQHCGLTSKYKHITWRWIHPMPDHATHQFSLCGTDAQDTPQWSMTKWQLYWYYRKDILYLKIKNSFTKLFPF